MPVTMIEEGMEPVIMMNKTRVEDGEGGYVTTWTDGIEFQAAITFDSSMQARIGGKLGATSLYTITTAKNAKLDFHDVIRRLSDGKVFRITSDGDDRQTPARAQFGQYLQVSAEEWILP